MRFHVHRGSKGKRQEKRHRMIAKEACRVALACAPPTPTFFPLSRSPSPLSLFTLGWDSSKQQPAGAVGPTTQYQDPVSGTSER